MVWLDLSAGQRAALNSELPGYAGEAFRDLKPDKGFDTHDEMKGHIEKLHEAIDSVPDWRRSAEEKEAWHASIDGTMVKGVGYPTDQDLPDMKAGEYTESED